MACLPKTDDPYQRRFSIPPIALPAAFHAGFVIPPALERDDRDYWNPLLFPPGGTKAPCYTWRYFYSCSSPWYLVRADLLNTDVHYTTVKVRSAYFLFVFFVSPLRLSRLDLRSIVGGGSGMFPPRWIPRCLLRLPVTIAVCHEAAA